MRHLITCGQAYQFFLVWGYHNAAATNSHGQVCVQEILSFPLGEFLGLECLDREVICRSYTSKRSADLPEKFMTWRHSVFLALPSWSL